MIDLRNSRRRQSVKTPGKNRAKTRPIFWLGSSALLIIALTLSGCGLGYEVRFQMDNCAHSKKYAPGMKVDASWMPDYFTIDLEKQHFCVRTGDTSYYSPEPTPAQVPEEVIAYGLKEFAGLETPDAQMPRIIKAIHNGIAGVGWTHLYYQGDKPLWVDIMYYKEYNQLAFHVHTEDAFLKPRTYSIDLTDADMKANSKAPAK